MDYVILCIKSNQQNNEDPDLNYSGVLSFVEVSSYYWDRTVVSDLIGKSKTRTIYRFSKLYKRDLDTTIKKFKSERVAKSFMVKERENIGSYFINRKWKVISFDKYQKIREKHMKIDLEKRSEMLRTRKSHNQEIIHKDDNLTPEQIKQNVKRVLAQAEKHKSLYPWEKAESSSDSGIIIVNDKVKFKSYYNNQRFRKEDKKYRSSNRQKGGLVNKCTQDSICRNTLFIDIILKDKNSGGYLKVPSDGSPICLVRSIKEATIFTNSNQTRWMINEIRTRSYMCYYHDWNMIEVDLNDKPIDIQTRLQEKIQSEKDEVDAALDILLNQNEPTDEELKEIENNEVNK